MEEMLSPDTELDESAADTVDSEAEEDLVEEAKPEYRPTARQDNKAHLSSSVPRGARVPTGALTKGEMAEIRSIFGNIDDAEIQRLYKRVTQ